MKKPLIAALLLATLTLASCFTVKVCNSQKNCCCGHSGCGDVQKTTTTTTTTTVGK